MSKNQCLSEDVSSHELDKSEFTSTLKDMSGKDENLFIARLLRCMSNFQYGITLPYFFPNSVVTLTRENRSYKLEEQLADMIFDEDTFLDI